MAYKKQISSQLRLALFVILCLGVLILLFLASRPDGRLHLIFCDVGQGDGILVITPSGKQILIDAGPDDSILSCLGSHMPFYDRTVELMVLTHPQLDHLGGQIEVLRRYQIEKILSTAAKNSTAEFLIWSREAEKEQAKSLILKQGQKILLEDNLQAQILWPIDGNFPQGHPSDLNQASIVLRFEYGQFCSLLSGDIGSDPQDLIAIAMPQSKCMVLKVPHHGSKNSISNVFWQQIQPQISIISAGENNRFGHPHSKTIEILNKLGSRILRTDKQGTIEVITDGKFLKIK